MTTANKATTALLAVLCALTMACGGGGSAPTSPSTTTTTTTPTTTTPTPTTPKEMVISYFAVDLASSPFLATSAFNVTDWPARVYPAIHVFGKTYQGQVESALTFDLLRIGTPIYAPFDGTIQDVVNQPTSCDTEMYFVDGNSDSQNHMSYDHVIPLDRFRTRGAAFRAGEQIATIGAWECTERFGRVEMMVINAPTGSTTPTRSRCPLVLLDTTKRSSMLALISSVMDWWNGLGPASAYTASERTNGLCATEFGPL